LKAGGGAETTPYGAASAANYRSVAKDGMQAGEFADKQNTNNYSAYEPKWAAFPVKENAESRSGKDKPITACKKLWVMKMPYKKAEQNHNNRKPFPIGIGFDRARKS
jgi:hypothetical protein